MATGEVATRKAAWMATVDTYNRRERSRRSDGRYKRLYTLARRIEHLSGSSTDFFCGKPPSVGGDFQFCILDGDNRHDGKFKKLDRVIGHLFPEIFAEPSTGGDGTHRLFKVSCQGRYGPADDEAMHNLVIGWSGRLRRVTQLLVGGDGGGSFCEIKGACCYWSRTRVDRDGIAGSYVMGSLARCPVTLTPEQIQALPVYSQAEIEHRIARLERLAGKMGPASVCEETATRQAPRAAVTATTGRRRGKAKRLARLTGRSDRRKVGVSGTVVANPDYQPISCPDAFARMIHAKCLYVRAYGRLPLDAETLVAFYERVGLAAGDPDAERSQRAKSVLEYAQLVWTERPSNLAVEFNADLISGRAGELEKLIPRSTIKGHGFKCGVKHIELAAYEVINFELNRRSGFASRDGIKRVMNDWHAAGRLPYLLDNHKMAAFRKVLTEGGLLVLTRPHRLPGWSTGTAASYKPAAGGFGRDEYLRQVQAELSEQEVVLSALDEANTKAGTRG